MHSSRMRTARLLTISRSAWGCLHLGCLPRGVGDVYLGESLPNAGVCLGVCLLKGMLGYKPPRGQNS